MVNEIQARRAFEAVVGLVKGRLDAACMEDALKETFTALRHLATAARVDVDDAFAASEAHFAEEVSDALKAGKARSAEALWEEMLAEQSLHEAYRAQAEDIVHGEEDLSIDVGAPVALCASKGKVTAAQVQVWLHVEAPEPEEVADAEDEDECPLDASVPALEEHVQGPEAVVGAEVAGHHPTPARDSWVQVAQLGRGVRKEWLGKEARVVRIKRTRATVFFPGGGAGDVPLASLRPLPPAATASIEVTSQAVDRNARD